MGVDSVPKVAHIHIKILNNSQVLILKQNNMYVRYVYWDILVISQW